MAAEHFTVLGERFGRLFTPTANVVRLFNGAQWAESPAFLPLGRFLMFSDAPNDRVMRYDECNGQTAVFCAPPRDADGA